MKLSEYLLHVTVQVKDLLLYIDVISGHEKPKLSGGL